MATNLSFINVKSKEEIKLLYKITTQVWQEFLPNFYSSEIINYIFYFLSEETLKDNIEKDGYFYYLIEKEGKIAGFFKGKSVKQILTIPNLFIEKSQRNKGLGTQTLSFIENFAKENDLNRILLFSDRSNSKAENFFLKNSYKFLQTQARYIGSDIYIYENVFEKFL